MYFFSLNSEHERRMECVFGYVFLSHFKQIDAISIFDSLSGKGNLFSGTQQDHKPQIAYTGIRKCEKDEHQNT